MRRTSLIASVIVAALAAVAVLAGNINAKERSKAKTVNLVLKDFKYAQVDNPALANANSSFPATGDLLVFSATITNNAGVSEGQLENSCTVTSGGSAAWQGVCYDVYELPGGVIDAMSIASRSSNIKESIVGGTGAYANDRGTVASKRAPNATPGSPVNETITLAS